MRWRPQLGPQVEAICANWCEELFYGGAAGGGKTDFLLADYLQDVEHFGAAWQGILFRRSMPELEEIMSRAQEMYPSTGGVWREQNKRWQWPNGAKLRLRYLEADRDATRYQGGAYCVAIDTPIRMANGSFRPIVDVNVGDMVATLEGPRRVTAAIGPYRAPCVRAEVYDADNLFLGAQVHPTWHPVLAGADWLAWSEDDRTVGIASSGLRPRSWPLGASFAPVTLHAPSARSAALAVSASHAAPTARRSPGRSMRLSSTSKVETRPSAVGLWLLQALLRSAWDRAGRWSTSAHAYARHAIRAVQGYLGRFPIAACFDGGRALAWSGTGPGHIPQSADVGGPSRATPPDASGTTPKRTPSHPSSWVHPYTGEARHLSEEVETGFLRLSPCGDDLVCDLTIEGANHYISGCGLINKNTWIGWDELGQHPTPFGYKYLRGRLRSAHPVSRKRIRSSANPGGVGHHWLKAKFVSPAPLGGVLLQDPDTGGDVMFIRAKLRDNAILMRNDPAYADRLKGMGSEALVRAWLDGDWDIVAGAFFSEFSVEKHVVRAHSLPESWPRFRSMDWGSAKPFSVGWWAISDGSLSAYPRGALIRYREWYGVKTHENGTFEPNVGIKMVAEEVGKGIAEREAGERVNNGASVLDPSAFDNSGGPSYAERIHNGSGKRVDFRRADNKRVRTVGAMGGWDQVRSRLVGEDGRPMIYFMDNCPHAIRTLPVLQHDELKPEDVDTEGEDHAPDECRYACMSRPYLPTSMPKKEPVFPGMTIGTTPTPSGIRIQPPTFDEMWKDHERANRNG